MGRCQSTPGLVETKGRTTVEEMWISPLPLPSAAASSHTQQRFESHFISYEFWLINLCFISATYPFLLQDRIEETV